MALRPANPNELESVHNALAEFRARWETIRAPFSCLFDGSLDDIRALDFLDYEGLPYPACGESGAALVWGNVVASQTPFRWFFDDELGGLVLRPPEEPFVIWPFGRVYESLRSGEPQFGKYRWLFDWVLVHCVGHRLLDLEEERRLVALLATEEPGTIRFIERTMERLRDLARGSD